MLVHDFEPYHWLQREKTLATVVTMQKVNKSFVCTNDGIASLRRQKKNSICKHLNNISVKVSHANWKQ